jgi:hypothetical protein
VVTCGSIRLLFVDGWAISRWPGVISAVHLFHRVLKQAGQHRHAIADASGRAREVDDQRGSGKARYSA